MPLYESVFIARQDISATQVDALTEAFAKIIEDEGGQVAKKEYWGLRNLAYRIRKNRKGHYVLFNIDAPAPALHEMERQMRISEDVLRYLTIKVDELEEGPSVMMQRGTGRDERPRRPFGGDRRPFAGDRPRESRDDRPAPEEKPEPAATDEAVAEGGEQ
jgi:small subunit ribosomal protein S6